MVRSHPSHNRRNSVLQRQVCWHQPQLLRAGIDQTALAIAEAPTDPARFSFLVVGDTDSGPPQTMGPRLATGLAEQIRAELETSQFLLHTGDVVYPLGGYRNYYEDWVEPYRWLLAHVPRGPGDRDEALQWLKPVLPVPGNHDYGDISPLGRTWMGILQPLCDRLRAWGVDLGVYGGYGGKAYGETFLDNLNRLNNSPGLAQYLADHYRTQLPSGYGLTYEPGRFTRLPNRYYSFCYGGVDFFALDSNTWNRPETSPDFDAEQLEWLEQRLIASWQNSRVMGRILYMHHSPYTTEETRWQEPETLWVRRHLRHVLDRVAIAIEPLLSQRSSTPLANLILSGHAHCLEHIQTGETGHGDANLDWVVCGGGGESLRRQRKTGPEILETLHYQGRPYTSKVAKSQLYGGVKERGRQRVMLHSFLRIEVHPGQDSEGTNMQLSVCPYQLIHEKGQWTGVPLGPLSLRNSMLRPYQSPE